MTARRRIIGIGVLFAAALLVVAARLFIERNIATSTITLHWPDANVRMYRITAVIVGCIVGTSLATSGVLLQALLRNPLASPYILGVSSGAGLGVIIWMHVGETTATLSGGLAIPAALGALGAMGIVYVLGQRRGVIDPTSTILIGVVVSVIAAAGIMFVQHLVTTGVIRDFTYWLMGRIPQYVPTGLLWTFSAFAILGVIVAMTLGRAMDAACFSDDEARSIGLALGPLRFWLFALSGLLAAITVVLAGPIGFVGLIAPHVARLVIGPRHTLLVIGAALVGIVLTVGADVSRQAIDIGGGRMPIGVFTALVGGPLFLWLLLSGRGSWGGRL